VGDETDVAVKLAVYRHFAETGSRPDADEVARRTGLSVADVLGAFQACALDGCCGSSRTVA
jgi:hypothetical protein